jgi:hypothetical protein
MSCKETQKDLKVLTQATAACHCYWQSYLVPLSQRLRQVTRHLNNVLQGAMQVQNDAAAGDRHATCNCKSQHKFILLVRRSCELNAAHSCDRVKQQQCIPPLVPQVPPDLPGLSEAYWCSQKQTSNMP